MWTWGFANTTFSRAFEEFARDELMQRVHARVIVDTLGHQLIGHISRDSTAIEARESIAKKTRCKWSKPSQKKRGRTAKGEVRPASEPIALGRQSSQTLAQIIAELDTACTTGTKKNAQGYKMS